MVAKKRLTKIYKSSEKIFIDGGSKIILMSDCHRGDASHADSFLNNQNIYFAALEHYFWQNYTYIELGDGDELWENHKLSQIIGVHKDVFWLLSDYYKQGRLYLIFGNHDIVKSKKNYIRNHSYFDMRAQKYIPLLDNIKVHEGLVLKYDNQSNEIFLIHGHQADFFNSTLWRLSRFLVRYVWKPFELFGVNDPTSAAKNYRRKEQIEKKLFSWARENRIMLIAGHTHRPVFPEPFDTAYFNDGSCVHPRCITAIEIACGNIALVKWAQKTKVDGTLYIGREVLAGPAKLSEYFANMHFSVNRHNVNNM